jgi:peptide/nickel transport system substrate-binding protein
MIERHTMNLRKHTRRDFVRLTGITAAGVVIAACARDAAVVDEIIQDPVIVEPGVEEPDPTTAPDPTVVEPVAPTPSEGIYNEAPMLAEMVARGELPPVDERLPEEPRVVPITDSIGQYGGTLTVGDLTMDLSGGDAHQAMGDWGSNWGRISKDLTHALPNVLKDWEVSDDYTEITFYMRRGMKWSDGMPLTTEDFVFWYEDVLLNPEITPLPHLAFRWGGETMRLDVIDDYTFKLTFAQPHPSFELVNIAHYYGFWGNNATWVPAHYMRQFHIKYNDQAPALASQAGFDFWYQYFGQRNNSGQNTERPTLRAYISHRDTPQMSFHVRNPYYHAVDPEGNQLPYLDGINMDRAADLAVFDAKVVGGTYDFAAFQLRILNYATYADGAAASGSRMILWESGKGGEVVYNVNMNWADEEWREVFSDDRFRQALSLAINRAEINNVIYFGNASETQMTVIPTSRHYKPEYAMAFAEYDPDRANELLDEMGLEWNAARTHRLWPQSRQPVIIAWDLVETETPKGPITELVTEYWRNVGIEIRWQSVTRTLLTQKILANEEPMSLWHGDETADTLFLRRPKFFAPLDGDESCWGVLWGRWYNTGGDQGEEPPQVIKDLYTWLDEYNLTDSDEPAARVLESQAEHVWTIGAIGNAPHPLLVRNNLRNVSETGGFWTWDSLWTFPEYAEQWYFEQ